MVFCREGSLRISFSFTGKEDRERRRTADALRKAASEMRLRGDPDAKHIDFLVECFDTPPQPNS